MAFAPMQSARGSVNGARIDRVIEAGAQAKAMTPDAVRQGHAAGTAMKRLTDPEDVAHMALFPASDAARMVTGQALAVDGMTCNVDPQGGPDGFWPERRTADDRSHHAGLCRGGVVSA